MKISSEGVVEFYKTLFVDDDDSNINLQNIVFKLFVYKHSL